MKPMIFEHPLVVGCDIGHKPCLHLNCVRLEQAKKVLIADVFSLIFVQFLSSLVLICYCDAFKVG